MRHALLALLLLAPAAASAAPARVDPPPVGLVVTAALGGGAELARGGSSGLGELELGAGWDAGRVRPELTLALNVAPDTFLALRPGVRVELPDGPFYARAALDFAHAGSDWQARWILAGAGAELRLTSVLAGFAEAAAGVPLRSERGLGILARAGFAFRF